MKLKKFTVTASVFFLILLESQLVFTHIAKPDIGVSGAPMEKTCYQLDQPGQGCHVTTAINTGPGNIAITFSGGAQYVPGNTYQVTFTVTDDDRFRFGFEGTVLNEQHKGIGNLSVPIEDTAFTSFQKGFFSLAGRQYVGHKNAWLFNGLQSWTVNWQAPDTNAGTIAFYACGNATNADSMPDGDHIYQDSIKIASSVDGVEEIRHDNRNSFNVLGNLVSGKLHVNYHLQQQEEVKLELVSMDGDAKKVLFHGKLPPNNSFQEIILSPDISKGLYILMATFDEKSIATEKIIIE